jgi:hypothetical protein
LVKSSVSFCMRIMSPLLTVAIVNVVSAKAATERVDRAQAPKRLFNRVDMRVSSKFEALLIDEQMSSVRAQIRFQALKVNWKVLLRCAKLCCAAV